MKIFKYLKRYWVYALLAPLFMVGEVAMDLIQPYLMREIVDVYLPNGEVLEVVKTGGIMLALVLFGGICGILCGVFTNKAAFGYSNDLRQDVFKHIVDLSFEQTDNFTTGSLVTRITNDITQVTNIVSMSMRMLIRTFMQFAMGSIMLIGINKEFSIILFIILPILLIMMIIFLIKLNPLFAKIQTRVDDVNAVVQENVTGARVVKAYTAENKEINRFKKANDNLFNINWKVAKIFSSMGPFMSICINSAMIAILYIGGRNIVNNAGTDLKVGDLTAAITFITIIFQLQFDLISLLYVGSINSSGLIIFSFNVAAVYTGIFASFSGRSFFNFISFSLKRSSASAVVLKVPFLTASMAARILSVSFLRFSHQSTDHTRKIFQPSPLSTLICAISRSLVVFEEL